MSIPVIAIFGRPNVGKSTLFNRIAGTRISIVSNVPGTTRDWISLNVESDDNRFILIDTGGIGSNPDDSFNTIIKQEVEIALESAELILFVVELPELATIEVFSISGALPLLILLCIVAAEVDGSEI